MKKRLKKLQVVSKYFYPVAAGIENNIHKTYLPLVKKGWKITIHTSRDVYDKKNLLPLNEIKDGLEIKRYEWSFLTGFWPGFDWNEEQIVCLHNFNIVPHFLILIFSLAMKILNRKKFKLIIIPHGGFSPEWSTFPLILRLPKLFYHTVISPFLVNKAVDGVRAVAYWEKSEMVKAGIKSDLIRVITNGIEDEAYEDIEENASSEIKKRLADIGDYIVQIGRIDRIKNQEVTIRALFGIKGLKFLIVGPVQDIKYKQKLNNLIEKLGLKERVIFLGVVRSFDKYYILKKAKAMVHMALWEGNCNVVNEAWSQKLVCIVADSKGLNEQIRDFKNGFLVKKDDFKTLIKRIEYVLDFRNMKVMNNMIEKNLIYVRNNSWKDVSERVEKFYTEKLLKKHAKQVLFCAEKHQEATKFGGMRKEEKHVLFPITEK